VFVTVHGISRNVEEHASLFAPFAEARGVVLVAPAFTEANEDYQRVGRSERGPRADEALDAILAEVHALTGVDTRRHTLFGFSGGGQFAHRYLMAHPTRVKRAALGAPGWYLFPDPRKPYPYGLGHSVETPGVPFEPDRFLRVPIAVFVGGDDVSDYHLRVNRTVNRLQGRTRVERAKRWRVAMRRAAKARGLKPRVRCVVVPGIGHSFADFMRDGELGERVFAFLYGDAKRVPPETPVSLG
jgi:pimeloyl-ACP methyl ester carboxylesterase